MIKQLSVILSLIIVMVSCGPSRIMTSSIDKEQVKDVAYFEPLSYIYLIEKGNRSQYSDSLSEITKTYLDSLVPLKKNQLKITEKISVPDDTINLKIENELAYLFKVVTQKQKLKGISITPTIDSILDLNKQRFALAMIATGFGRKRGNYGGQVAKGAAIGLLTLGMVVPIAVKSNLTLHTFIFDSERDDIAFYRKLIPNKEREPTDSKYISSQLDKIFEGYYYKKQYDDGSF